MPGWRRSFASDLLWLGIALAVAPVQGAAQAADRLAVSDQVYTGWKYFQVYCSRCHGDDALGTMAAPDLTYSLSEEGGITADSFNVIVREGASSSSAAPDQNMRGFEDLLDQTLIDALYSYVRLRSEGTLAPGRPHRVATPQ